MNIYRYRADSNRYASVSFPSRNTEYLFFKGKGMAREWKPIDLEVDLSQGELGDFPSLTHTVPVLSSKAFAVLKPLIGNSAEALSVSVNGQRFFALNVIDIIDALDREKCQFRYFSSGSIADVIRYVVFEEKLVDKHIFKVPESRNGDVLLSEEFKTTVEKNGLVGARFLPVPQ